MIILHRRKKKDFLFYFSLLKREKNSLKRMIDCFQYQLPTEGGLAWVSFSGMGVKYSAGSLSI
jgi:hypothetical protein